MSDGRPDAGWYANPTGREFKQRYYDGTAWTTLVRDHAGNQTVDERGTPPGSPRTAPAVVVRASQVPPPETPPRQARSGFGYQPTPTVIVRHRSRWPWVLLAIFVLGGVGFASCALLAARSPLRTLHELTKVTPERITLAEFKRIHRGMTHAQVTQIVGSSGIRISQSDVSGVTEESWDFQGTGSLGAHAIVSFRNGAVDNKTQFDLE